MKHKYEKKTRHCFKCLLNRILHWKENYMLGTIVFWN